MTRALALLGFLCACNAQRVATDDCVDWFVVVEFKRGCGFVDLGQLVTAQGTVLDIGEAEDGDFIVDLILDEPYRWLLYYGDRETSRNGNGSIHVEVMPCERRYADIAAQVAAVKAAVAAGGPVRLGVEGRWSFDGVEHLGLLEGIAQCAIGKDPDPSNGWTEIHPAYSLTVLE